VEYYTVGSDVVMWHTPDNRNIAARVRVTTSPLRLHRGGGGGHIVSAAATRQGGERLCRASWSVGRSAAVAFGEMTAAALHLRRGLVRCGFSNADSIACSLFTERQR